MQSAVEDAAAATTRGESQSGPREALEALPSARPAAPVEHAQAESSESDDPAARKSSANRAALLEFAVFASLMAGAAGIVRATQMERPLDIVICLIGSVAGCSLVSYLYFRRD